MINEETKKLANDLSHYVNSMSNGKAISDLCDEMQNDHRTLQQGYTRFALEWLYRLSQNENNFDLRNEASVEIAKKIDKAIGLKYARYLPYI